MGLAGKPGQLGKLGVTGLPGNQGSFGPKVRMMDGRITTVARNKKVLKFFTKRLI